MKKSLEKKMKTSPISVQELKFNIFAPNSRGSSSDIRKNEVVYEDENYQVKISGVRLNQTHRDILDIILMHGEDVEKDMNRLLNQRGKKFSLYLIQKKLGFLSKGNGSWVKDKIKDLELSVIEIKDIKNKLDYSFHLSRSTVYSEKENSFIFYPEDIYLSFFERQFSVGYQSKLDDILKIKSPQLKSCIRYMLSHSKGQKISIKKLMNKMGIVGSDRYLRRIEKDILDEMEEKSEIFGITVKKGIKSSERVIEYSRLSEVVIAPPVKMKEESTKSKKNEIEIETNQTILDLTSDHFSVLK